jgi:hypothetical protein
MVLNVFMIVLVSSVLYGDDKRSVKIMAKEKGSESKTHKKLMLEIFYTLRSFDTLHLLVSASLF